MKVVKLIKSSLSLVNLASNKSADLGEPQTMSFDAIIRLPFTLPITKIFLFTNRQVTAFFCKL